VFRGLSNSGTRLFPGSSPRRSACPDQASRRWRRATTMPRAAPAAAPISISAVSRTSMMLVDGVARSGRITPERRRPPAAERSSGRGCCPRLRFGLNRLHERLHRGLVVARRRDQEHPRELRGLREPRGPVDRVALRGGQSSPAGVPPFRGVRVWRCQQRSTSFG
jgi:hypothetical protein